MRVFDKIKIAALAGALVIAGVGAVMMPRMAYAETYEECLEHAETNADMVKCATEKEDEPELTDVVKKIINTILYIVGILAVVMMIYGGVQYTTSAGNAAQVTKAKNTIIYGLVGLVIAVLAYAIVNFVLTRIA